MALTFTFLSVLEYSKMVKFIKSLLFLIIIELSSQNVLEISHSTKSNGLRIGCRIDQQNHEVELFAENGNRKVRLNSKELGSKTLTLNLFPEECQAQTGNMRQFHGMNFNPYCPKGQPGQQGPVGPTGPAGRPGNGGRDGTDGLNGRDGIDGQRGRRGEEGPSGPIGPKGGQGPQGLRGAIGLPGISGSMGRDGQQGPPGSAGQDGQNGRNGIPGRDGQQGVIGPAGANGQNGRPGLDGTPGICCNRSQWPQSQIHSIGSQFQGIQSSSGAPICGTFVLEEMSDSKDMLKNLTKVGETDIPHHNNNVQIHICNSENVSVNVEILSEAEGANPGSGDRTASNKFEIYKDETTGKLVMKADNNNEKSYLLKEI